MIKSTLTGILAALYFDPVQADTSRSSKVDDVGPFINETWYSGTIDITWNKKPQGDIFYWWFESRSDPTNDPVVLWLTGGPGCSSEIALFYENGPYHFNDDGKTLKTNPYSWNEKANLIYIDQPIGTGFSKADSITDLDTDEDEIADTAAQFMIKFLEKFPQLKHKDFFITGESYAGHYIPSISHNFIFKNKAFLTFNFKGMAIGNGLVDPYLQYPQYNTFALENGVIDKVAYDLLVPQFLACQAAIATGIWFEAMPLCQEVVGEIIDQGRPYPQFNVYDIREKCEKPPLCYDFSPASTLMQDPSVQKVIGVTGRKWEECSGNVHTALFGDWLKNQASKVQDILDYGLDTLVYSGDKDFICNWRGGEKWVGELKWKGAAEYTAANYTDWNVDSKAAGQLKTYNNLKFLRIYDAGHMVPMNKPEQALTMLQQFTGHTVLETKDTAEEKDSIIQ